jgi:hypothetical protein
MVTGPWLVVTSSFLQETNKVEAKSKSIANFKSCEFIVLNVLLMMNEISVE